MENKKAFALLIGIDSYGDERYLPVLRYAEKDCHDIAKVLTDPKIGGLPQENVHLVVGSEATTRNLESLLYSIVVQRNSDELVILYFSGHGFVTGDPPEGYLGTRDVHTTELLKNPNAGLRMRYLHEDIFLKSKALNIVFILDCCHSGSLVPSQKRSSLDHSTSRGLLDDTYFTTGRVAICSCPADARSRENDKLQNGIFTHYILKGLSGDAVEHDTGQVTVDSLMAYVRMNTPPDQPPGRYGQDFSRIVLASPQRRRLKIGISKAEKFLPAAEPVHLANPLDSCADIIRDLVASVSTSQAINATDPEYNILEAVKAYSGADVVLLLHNSSGNWSVKNQSSRTVQNDSARGYSIESVVGQFLATISSLPSFGEFNVGLHYTFSDRKRHTVTVLVLFPHRSVGNELILVCGVRRDSILVDDVFGRIVSTLYSASGDFGGADPSYLESAIIDDLKRTYRLVPVHLYERRFELFTRRLKNMTIHFQPVLHMTRKAMVFESWEALARDPLALASPTDLFDAAELWGHRFMIELDVHFVRLATTSYREAFRALGTRDEDIRELSVNVYPQSLMRSAYYRAIKELVAEEQVIPANKLTLEISEKTPIPSPEVDKTGGALKVTFKERLLRFVREFEISFGIDDFGVGYASFSRLAGLNPAYVKVDREVLSSDLGDLTIQYVIGIAQNGLRQQRVVVEGFDESSRITLGKLFEIGVRRVQGYLIGRPSASVYPLDSELEKYLLDLINKPVS